MSLFWIYLDCTRYVSSFELRLHAFNKNCGKAIRGNVLPFLRLHCCFCLHPSDFCLFNFLPKVYLFSDKFYCSVFNSVLHLESKRLLPWWIVMDSISK